MKDMGFDVNKPKSKIPKKRMEQIEQYVDEIDESTKQFASILNKLPTTSEDNQDNIMLQDITNKNEFHKIDRNIVNGDRRRSIYSNWWANT